MGLLIFTAIPLLWLMLIPFSRDYGRRHENCNPSVNLLGQ